MTKNWLQIDIKFNLDDKYLTLYIRPNKKMTLMPILWGYQEIIKEFASEGLGIKWVT